MNARHCRVLLTFIAAGFVASACASDTGSVWTFAPVTAEADEATTSADPAESAAETAEPAPPSPEAIVTPGPAEDGVRVVELESTASLLFLQHGERIPDIAVTPGETVRFSIDNTAGFAHNFYIGEDSVLSVPLATTEVGIAAWESGVRELEWVVPDDIAGLMFGCTIPGHYFTQQGTFSVAP